jgi:hypothetical protein
MCSTRTKGRTTGTEVELMILCPSLSEVYPMHVLSPVICSLQASDFHSVPSFFVLHYGILRTGDVSLLSGLRVDAS